MNKSNNDNKNVGGGQDNPAFEPDTKNIKIAAEVTAADTILQLPDYQKKLVNDESLKTSKLELVFGSNNAKKSPSISSITKDSQNLVVITNNSIHSFHNYNIIKNNNNNNNNNKNQDATNTSCKIACGHIIHKFLGIILTLATSFIMSLGSFFVQILQNEGGYSPYLTTFWRFVGVLVPAIPTLFYFQFYTKKPILEPIWPLSGKAKWKNLFFIISRAVVGTAGFITQYYALSYITLADTSVISFSSPVLVILFGKLCLGEPCGIFPTIISIVTVFGVMIIAKPPFIFGGEELSQHTLIGIIYASSGCLSNALVFICLRFLKDVHFSLISIAFGIIGLTISLTLSISTDVFKIPTQWDHIILFLAVACIGFIGQVGLTFALKYEQAGIVSAFRTSDVIFSFIWQFTKGIFPQAYSVIGAFVVILCVSLLAFRKWLAAKDKDAPIVKHLWFVLK